MFFEITNQLLDVIFNPSNNSEKNRKVGESASPVLDYSKEPVTKDQLTL